MATATMVMGCWLSGSDLNTPRLERYLHSTVGWGAGIAGGRANERAGEGRYGNSLFE